MFLQFRYAGILLGLFGAGPAFAQDVVKQNIQLHDHNCSYLGERLPKTITAFSSTLEARDLISRIVAASGLVQNFKIAAGGVPNAAASTEAGERWIYYNPSFINDLRARVKNRWAAASVMAHEVGHHLNGHTLKPGGSRPKTELEADLFSGFVLQRLGATMSDAQAVMRKFGSSTGSRTHPARRDRLAAIGSGWEKACEKDPSCANKKQLRYFLRITEWKYTPRFVVSVTGDENKPDALVLTDQSKRIVDVSKVVKTAKLMGVPYINFTGLGEGDGGLTQHQIANNAVEFQFLKGITAANAKLICEDGVGYAAVGKKRGRRKSCPLK